MDYIRKQDALAVIMDVWQNPDYDAHPLSEAYDRVAKLPVYTPYQKKGIWNWKGNGWTGSMTNYDLLQCSVCGEIVNVDLDQAYKYCPNCGAEMITDEQAVTAEFWADVERETALLKREEANG